jgi:hypothetical protein
MVYKDGNNMQRKKKNKVQFHLTKCPKEFFFLLSPTQRANTGCSNTQILFQNEKFSSDISAARIKCNIYFILI